MSTKTRAPVHRSVGRIIHMMRKERGMRQSELASLTGLKQPNLSRIENGLVIPRRRTLEKVAMALDVEVGDLLSEAKAREVESKWDAALSPQNAGQLLAGQLSPVPLYRLQAGWSVEFNGTGHPVPKPDLTLQLPPLRGQVFGLTVTDESMIGSTQAFRPGEIVVFGDEPPVQSGDLAYVQVARTHTFRRVIFESEHAVRLEALNPSVTPQVFPRADLKVLWKLLRHIRSF